MAGLNRVALAKKVFEQYNGQVFGAQTIKGIVRINLSSDENKVVSYCKTLRSLGIFKEVKPFRFLIDTNASPPLDQTEEDL